MDPKNLNAYNYRGVAYQRKGDLERAIHDYDAALGIRHNKEAYANRGFAWLSLSEWDKARPDLLKADHMGLNLVAAFQEDCGSAPEFEEKYNVKLPQDLANLVSIEAIPGSNSSGESVLEMFRRIRESIPYVEFDEMPPDASKN